jgi:hypothetical protein
MYIYSFDYIYKHVYIHTCRWICYNGRAVVGRGHIYSGKGKDIDIYAHIFMHKYTYMDTYTIVYVYVHTYARKYVYICIYTCLYIHINMYAYAFFTYQ